MRSQDENLTDDVEPDSGPNESLLNNINSFSTYSPTIRATLHAVASSLLLPAMLVLLVWQLSGDFERTLFQGAVLRGLIWVIPVLLACRMAAKSLRPGELAEVHFGWSPALNDALLKTTSKLIWLYLPMQFLFVSLETYSNGDYYESLGRLAFIGAMTALGLGLWGTCRAINRWLDSQPDSENWFGGLRKVGFIAVTLIPVALIVMASAGYFFTAVQISWRLIWTLLVMVGIGMVAGLVSRLLLITQFRIKLRQLQRDDDGEIRNDESIDITEITGQVNRLLRVTSLVAMTVVAWQVWADVLPVIGYLDQIELWTTQLSETGVQHAITLRHLLMSIGLLCISFVLSRNLPGLLEITVLDRLPLDKGGRYAISFVLRYVVGIIGTLMAFQVIGFSWKGLQWLAAGLTVGLGFGLQEIFANLVSGIIILVERPVRVGDLVTVNGVTGTVTRMQLRATTIKDLDHRELIVPNKKFITEDVMNWTLSDKVSRLIFEVGIAYGSDTKLAYETLLATARNHPLTLEDPAPEVVFKKFGDSTLDFQLRVFLPTRDQFSKVIHDLNMAIDAAFREKDIEIAFPQREIHVKSSAELVAPVARNTSPAEVVSTPSVEEQQHVESDFATTRSLTVDGPHHREVLKPTARVFKLKELRESEFDFSGQEDISLPK